jgi:hypothetical protein
MSGGLINKKTTHNSLNYYKSKGVIKSEIFGSADKYSCLGAAILQDLQYFPGRMSFRQT